jgi:glycosyltransferase involved in cell wall biosynthesis
MKIVMIVDHFPPKWLHGTEIATYNLAKHLAKRKHEIHVITSYDEGLPKGLPNFDIKCGFYVHRIAWPKIRIVGVLIFWLKIFFEIRIINPDIVQVQSLGIGIPAWLSRKILKIPFIIWGRGGDVYQPSYYIRMTSGLILRDADAIIALTEDMRIKLKEISSREIFVVPNGIDLDQFNNMFSNVLKEEDFKKIICVGRFHPIKGHQYLIKAMKRVHDEIADAVLILIGDGEERERLEALSIKLDIQKSVQFTGEVPHEQIHSHMHQADIFVLPSISEGFPSVILEAMACGLPIVASRVGGIPDIITNDTNGYLVEVKDSNDLANKMIILLQDDVLRKKISDNNRLLVKKYSWENVIFELEKIYELSIT